MSSVSLNECLDLLPTVMKLGHPSRIELLPLEGLAQEEIEELGIAIKARCLSELPQNLALEMLSQEKIAKGRHKNDFKTFDTNQRVRRKLMQFAGPEMVKKVEALENLSAWDSQIAPKGGQFPNVGIQFYVCELVNRSSEPYDYYGIAKKIVLAFRDHYSPNKWRDDPHIMSILGQTLVRRALRYQEKRKAIELTFDKALNQEKIGEEYIKCDPVLVTPKITVLYKHLERSGIGVLLRMYQSRLVDVAKMNECRYYM